MPTERMEEVEVVCGGCNGEGTTVGYPGYCPQGGPDGARYTCWVCGGNKSRTALVPEGSLTAARLRLADAAEADEMARLKYEASGDGDAEWRAACGTRMAFLEAMNVVRALRTARGEG